MELIDITDLKQSIYEQVNDYKMSVINNNFSLSLLDNNNEYILCVDGNFFLKHGTEYKILITNQSDCRANADIFVDGKNVGLFRIEKKNNILIERSADNQKARKLTFFNVSSKEAKMGQIDSSNRDIGKLQIKIQKEATPKQDKKVVFASCTETDGIYSTKKVDNRHNHDETSFRTSSRKATDETETDSCVRESIGGTALGRPSDQCFRQANHIETDNDIIILEARMLLLKERIIPL